MRFMTRAVLILAESLCWSDVASAKKHTLEEYPLRVKIVHGQYVRVDTGSRMSDGSASTNCDGRNLGDSISVDCKTTSTGSSSPVYATYAVMSATVDNTYPYVFSCLAPLMPSFLNRCTLLDPGIYYARWKDGNHTQMVVVLEFNQNKGKVKEVTYNANGDIPLDPAKFAAQSQPPAVAPAQQPANPRGTVVTSAPQSSEISADPNSKTVPATTPASNSAVATKAKVIITSIPQGADIEVDGSFMGNTPSTVELSSGDYTIKIKKSGFWTWDRKVKLTTGEIKIHAVLESIAKWTSQ